MITAVPYGESLSVARGSMTDGLGPDSRVIGTVADLMALGNDVPPHAPLRFDPVVRGARGLTPREHPQVIVAGIRAEQSDAATQGRPQVLALELAIRLVPEDGAPIPQESEPCDHLERMNEAFDAGDVGSGLRALADALSDAAGEVVTEGRAWLPPRSPLCDELEGVAATLRGVAANLRSSLAYAADAEMRRAETV